MTDLFAYLQARPYPGRGILLGATSAGKSVAAYFIMGRSENSRNRIFIEEKDGIRTEAFDPSKLVDPSLIIYHPVRRFGENLIVTNGDQTDTVRDYLSAGRDFHGALMTREFEPDAPNYTPRISGLLRGDGSYSLSILKSADGDPAVCQRFFYTYGAAKKGCAHFISTYEGFGSPIPSFSGEPILVQTEDWSAGELIEKLWNSMNADNRISLYVNVGGAIAMKNKNLGD